MKNPINGFLNIYKPPGITSSNVVVKIRRAINDSTVRVGHAGTLDPEAAGVLPIMLGKATRLFDYIVDKRKGYTALIRLGITTDTQDAQGNILDSREVNVKHDDVCAAACRFTGAIKQIPPAYSAIKVDGKPMYKRARSGEQVQLAPRDAMVYAIEIQSTEMHDAYIMRVECGKGVYIRTLAHDIGQALGCGAHMETLERGFSGAFKKEDSTQFTHALDIINNSEINSILMDMDYPLAHHPMLEIDEKYYTNISNGQIITLEMAGGRVIKNEHVRIYCGGHFAGMAQLKGEGYKLRAVFLDNKQTINKHIKEA